MAAGLQTNHPNQVSNPRLQLPSNIAERLVFKNYKKKRP